MSDARFIHKYDQGHTAAGHMIDQLLLLRTAFRVVLDDQLAFEKMCLTIHQYNHPTLVGLVCFALERLQEHDPANDRRP